jgi:RNA polymerase sigma factor (sigma-70 family)
MTAATTTPDRDLVRSYASEGSETAFRALVGRHVDLVFATALRQVGDTGLAEEITQNVFVQLARKAPALAGHETIAGWLHRSAILESKARFRAEMRRRRREEVAAALAETESAGRDPAADLSPLLDEALLQLREADRLALVLRFLEERSLREVGTALGIDEDAARKRVSRALSRVTEFFRSRGFALPSAGGAALLSKVTQAAPAVPPGLASSAAAAGLAAGGPASGLGLLLLSVMSLTKTQTALLCGVLVLAPLAWQSASLAHAQRAVDSLERDRARFNGQVADAEQELAQLDRTLLRVRNETAAARTQLAQMKDGLPKPASDSTASGQYRWDDNAPLVRLPKRLLADLRIEGNANPQGEMSPEIRGILQLTDDETRKVQSAIDRFAAAYQKLILKIGRPVEPAPHELGGRSRDRVLVLEFKGLEKPARALFEDLMAELRTLLDAERLMLLAESGKRWIHHPDIDHFSYSQSVFIEDHRLCIEQVDPSSSTAAQPFANLHILIFFGEKMTTIDGIPVFSATRFPTVVSHFARPLIQPWLDAIRQRLPSSPPEASTLAKP